MKKIITLIGIVSAIVFINPAQAKADVKAYVYFNPLAWLFAPPVRVVNKPVYRYREPLRREVVYVQPKSHKRLHRSHYGPKKHNKLNRHKRYSPKKFSKLKKSSKYSPRKLAKYKYSKRKYNKKKNSNKYRW